jgi:hypothetical protein
MQFITAASLFAVALAAPAPQASGAPTCPEVYENINVTDFSLRKNNGTIQSVSFKMTGDAAKEPILCSIGESPSFPSEMVTCDDGKSKYRVVLIAPKDGSTDPEIAMYHETGQASGLWNEVRMPTHEFTWET